MSLGFLICENLSFKESLALEGQFLFARDHIFKYKFCSTHKVSNSLIQPSYPSDAFVYSAISFEFSLLKSSNFFSTSATFPCFVFSLSDSVCICLFLLLISDILDCIFCSNVVI
jgi:hypothetical protein